MKLILLITTTALLALSFIKGPYPDDQMLQHCPTVITLFLLGVVVRKNGMSNSSFCCVIAFIWLHILGGRYTYSNVPYDSWAINLCDSSVSDWFDWERNHYDRLVHFCFGLLFMLPFFEFVMNNTKLSNRWGILFALSVVSALGALYEVFEWLLSVVMSPADADSYNGQQGDFWDAQKDMALALAGSLIAIPLMMLYLRKED